MSNFIRTSGDGTENPDKPSELTPNITKTTPSNTEEINLLGKQYLSKQLKASSSGDQLLLLPSSSTSEIVNFPLPVEPKGKRFYLIPRLAPKSNVLLKNRTKLSTHKLVLLEPYKACVSPIIPYRNNENKVKSSKNNLQLNELMRHLKMEKEMSTKICEGSNDDLQTQRDNLEKQLKFQIQVNAELKGLLVHCLGEDLQAKVNNLTEDKMKIANSLSSNTEKIEYLSSQTEVWRSKFLASSLMVEELAKVKTILSQKNVMLTSSNKQLLVTIEKVRSGLMETYQNLKYLSNSNDSSLKSLNVIDLAHECLNMSQTIALNSGKIGLPSSSNFDHLATVTEAESLAMKALSESNETQNIDEAFMAVCNQAHQEYKRDRVQSESDDYEVISMSSSYRQQQATTDDNHGK